MKRAARVQQHRRFAHSRTEKLRETSWSDWVDGLEYLGPHDRITCACCMCMNAKKAPFQREAEERSVIPGERIHSDVKELPIRSIDGHIYAVCFVDDATRRCATYPIKKKSEVIDKLEQFLLTECAATGKAVKYLRSDHGGEFDSEEMELFCASRGIWQEFSPPHCPSANGVAEVAWRDTFKMVRSMLHDQQRPPKYWAIALRFATYLRNRLMTNSVADRPPEAAWRDRKISVAHLRVPLSTCYAFIEKKNRTDTLGERRMKGVFVGYATHSPAYLVYSPEMKRVYERRYADVEFDETSKVPEEGIEAYKEEDAKQLAAFFDALENQTEVPEGEVRPSERDSLEAPSTLPSTGGEETEAAAGPPEHRETAPAQPAEAQEQQRAETPARESTAQQQVPPGPADRWFRTTKKMTVTQLARLFNKPTAEYHAKLLEYEGWYQQLTSADSVVGRGSDVPVPHDVPIPRTARKRNRKKSSAMYVEGVQVEASRAVRRRLQGTQRERAHAAMQAHEVALTALWHEHACAALALPDPKSVKQALARGDADEWKKAMTKEWTGLWNKEAFAKAKKEGQKLHHMLWVFKRKGDGTYKARLCFDGRRQDPSTYDNIASPTMKLTSFRILLALAAQRGWSVFADDATQAFLNAPRPADKPLYAAYPEGFRSPDNACLLVKRMLYGLHDAPMGWFAEVRNHLVKEQGFKQSRTDACLFHKPGVWVVCHVDDFASTGEPDKVAEFRRTLHKRFKMTGGLATEYYGLEVHQDLDNHVVSLSCAKYLQKAMQKLGLAPKKWVTPMDQTLDLPVRTADAPPDPKVQKRYRQLVGTAMHPSVTCRPDVSAAVRALSVHLQNPGKEHVKAAERVMQYLHCTRHLQLTWKKRERFTSSFFGTCDAAHNVTKDSKGITGWAYQIAGGSVSWKCRAQSLTALSSTEAELIAVDDAAREAQFLHKLLQDFGLHVSEIQPTTIFQDNQSTIKLIDSEHWNARTKHVAIRYHHTGDLVKQGQLKITYLSTDLMPADALTKPLPHSAHCRHRAVLLGLATLRQTPARGGEASQQQN